MKFYQTRSFMRLQREWTARLVASGFRDIETADGEFVVPDTKRGAGAQDVDIGYDCVSRAQGALENEMVWAGLTVAHRRFWALLTMGLPEKVAGRLTHKTHGGRGEAKSRAWRKEILARVERLSRA